MSCGVQRVRLVNAMRSNRFRHLMTIFALIALPATGWAANCANVLATDELILCLGDEFVMADRRLNASYSALRARLAADRRVQLKDAQSAWVALRDKDCEFEAGAAQGGQAYQPLYISCQTRKTLSRIQELRILGN